MRVASIMRPYISPILTIIPVDINCLGSTGSFAYFPVVTSILGYKGPVGEIIRKRGCIVFDAGFRWRTRKY